MTTEKLFEQEQMPPGNHLIAIPVPNRSAIQRDGKHDRSNTIDAAIGRAG